MTRWNGPDPIDPVGELEAYSPPKPAGPIDLELAGNEGPPPPQSVLDALCNLEAEQLRRYPDLTDLRAAIAAKHEVDTEQVLLTAGGDQAIELLARTFLGDNRSLLTHTPSFVMIERAGQLAGGEVEAIEWTRGTFPVDTFLQAADGTTKLAVIVSPNNPTGATISREELLTIADTLSQALVVVDHAYVEFADEDLTGLCLERSNVAVIRTFSKTMGLAGARVGYLLGAAPLVQWLRRIRSPYPIATPSLTAALARLETAEDVTPFIEAITVNRNRLTSTLEDLGVDVYPSEANFILGAYRDARWVFDGLASMGIRTRLFPNRPNLTDHVRITVPGDGDEIERVESAFEAVLAPQAVLFDMDGVLADIRDSYRMAIIETAATYGVEVSNRDIEHRKDEGNANDDWELTHELLRSAGIEVPFEEVKATFESWYLGKGDDQTPLYEHEELLVGDSLDALAGELPLGIVTGRPRRDAHRFLEQAGITDYFDTVVCKEDAPIKPDPAPIELAMNQLGCTHAWFVGDTPDDIRAARRAGVVPLGIVPPGADQEERETALQETGAARVLEDIGDLLPLLHNATSHE